VSFARLSWGHWLAAGAALALLLIMAMDWYGTAFSDSLRRDEGLVSTEGQLSGETGRELAEQIPPAAELGERNAWQAYAGFDTVTTVRSGAPLGLLALGLLTLGAARAMREEQGSGPAGARSAPRAERARRPVA